MISTHILFQFRNRIYHISIFEPTFVYLLISFPVLVCSKYDEMINKKQPPHVILDTTVTGVGSETVKSFSVALGIPTITASFGQEGDLRQWRSLNDQKRNYLLQVNITVMHYKCFH